MPKHFVHEGATRWWGILESNTSCHWSKFPPVLLLSLMQGYRQRPKISDSSEQGLVNLPMTPWPWHRSGESKISPDVPILACAWTATADSWSFIHRLYRCLPFTFLGQKFLLLQFWRNTMVPSTSSKIKNFSFQIKIFWPFSAARVASLASRQKLGRYYPSISAKSSHITP